MGTGPVYLSFDIDGLDPAFAPGTGTPEIAGLTPIQVCFTCASRLEMLKSAPGVNSNAIEPNNKGLLLTLQPYVEQVIWKLDTIIRN